MTDVSKIYHANLYIDGTNSMLGRLSEIKLPDRVANTEEHKALGMVGTLELPTGLAAMVMTFKWNGFYADVKKFSGNPFKGRRFQLRANHETFGEGGRIAEVPLVVTVGGTFKKAGASTFKPMEAGETDDEVAVSYIKAELDGDELYEIDVLNNIWRVGGEDVLETMRQNLGVG